MLCWIQIRTDGRPWYDFDVVLLEKVPAGSGSVLLEHVMLVKDKIGHNVKSKNLIDIPQTSFRWFLDIVIHIAQISGYRF